MEKIALITGASRGFGAAVALEAAIRDYHVIAVARTTGGLEDLDDRIKDAGGAATLVPLDLTDAAGQQNMCKAVHDRWGGVDLWVHTANHAAPLTPASHIDIRDWDKSLTTNVSVTQKLIVNVAPLLEARAGTAIWCEDDHTGDAYFGSYAATKAAQSALFQAWQAETQKAALKVQAFSPAPMPTATRARFFPGEDRTPLSDPGAEAARLLNLLQS